MDAFAGFEPQVGEIRAVRSFRVGPDGTLYPLFSDQAWVDGTNTARCRVTPDDPDHGAPDPECTCGFYAYASARAADEYPHARHVLAVVACWGRVIAGSRGIRAEKARIEAIWMSPKVPEYLRRAVTARYSSAVVESDVDQLLADHPPSELSCYDPQPPREPRARQIATRLAVGVALFSGVLPQQWLGGTRSAYLLWSAEVIALVTAAVIIRLRHRDAVARRRVLVLGTAALWVVAPLAGAAGVLLLRLPLLQLTALALAQRATLFRSARSFPAEIG
jgi:hypothetical protein